jgi:octopine/nopaline transport system permease protein
MDLDFVSEHFPRLLKATKLTIELTCLSLFFGIFVGVFFAILRTSKNKILFFISYYYSYIFRGTPLLVQIFIIYFGLGQVEWIRESFLWIFLKEPYSCAILAFTLNTGAYSSEIFRSAFETINKGILEAAEGLGLNKTHTFFKIKLPIVIKQSLPAYGNEMILMLKGTSLASTVTLLDLTGVAKHIISTTFRPVEVFIVAGSIYLLMTFIIHNFIKFLEKRLYYPK